MLVAGRNIHAVRTDQRDCLAIHYHQSCQVRDFRSLWPDFLMQPAGSDYPVLHLFDEPQFNTQDGHIGFMLDFLRRLRDRGCLVFPCVHPNERIHLEIVEEICESFIFVNRGAVTPLPDYAAVLAHDTARAYLGDLLSGRAA